ncbi:MAG: UDP-N-acetylglucosamine--N-acetylmuramyl-(pentapeptide) pyrophosphoryl-undecaprenol N-acetylglucosamine transferase [Coriobacteriales bacterium]|nr:UDP-N-acetylglucosamine--N-acetylmuramyl-(pentapeptide) pyrophosphoryl-undecaprenol N-acetylglucosamine transferase [Coriobacteriales bacterium]
MGYIALAAGGTAGHVNPALALAEELVKRGHTVRFYGTTHGMEGQLVRDAGIDFCGLDVSGFDRARPHTAVQSILKITHARDQLLKEFGDQGVPDAAVGFGAYVEMPLAWAVAHCHKPLVLHEQNSVPGMANKLMAHNAAIIALTYPSTETFFAKHAQRNARIVVCGNPVRASVLAPRREESRKELGIDEKECMLMIFGGSLGAQHINEAVARLKQNLLERPNLVVLHATGRRDYERALESLQLTPQEEVRWRVLPYIDNMGTCLAAADCVVSRAGASSIAELAARCVPSLLVPYPYATADHQTTNARYLVDAGGARVISDDRLDGEEFDQEVFELVDNSELRAQMYEGLKTLGASEAAARLADAVESTLL